MTTSNQTRIALITGANKGLGLETARQLGKQKIAVVLGARTLANAEAAAGKLRSEGIEASPVKLDVTDANGIEEVAADFGRKYGRLDILINNAGIFLDGQWGTNTVNTIEMDVIRKTLETNLLGVIAVTRAFLPLLKKSPAGRIVNVSSIMGSLTLHAQSDGFLAQNKPFAYDVSKTALNQYTVHLAALLRDTPMKVNSAHPGWVKTALGTDAAPMDVTEGAKTAVELALLGPDGPTGAFFHAGQPLPW